MRLMTTTFLNAALRALELGHTPIPITPNQKHPPLCNWKEYQNREPTEDEVRKWWSLSPKANVAVLTGKPNGLDVLDLDPDKNGKLPEWPGTDYDLPVECVASTPRGGRHYLCQHTPGIKNSASQLAPHVDVRGEGGYVLVEPSVVNGKPYEFVLGDLSEISSPFPAWLIDEIKDATNGSRGTEISSSEASKIFDSFNQSGTNTKYGLTALKDEVRKIKVAPEGARNDTLNHASFALGQLIIADQLAQLTVEQELFSAATEVGLKPTEIQATITSGLSAGGMKPRTRIAQRKNSGILPPAECASAWMQEILQAPGIILKDLFDIGTKAALMGPSKSRKSYMLLQLLVSLAAGLDRFLVWEIEKARRVLLVQFEITPYHYHKRLNEVCKNLKIEPSQMGDRFDIINARGRDLDCSNISEIIDRVKSSQAEIVCIDPLYKILVGDESDQAAVKPLLKAFDLLCETTGASIVYSHHYAKGLSGDKATIDRGSGSGLFQRDFDVGVFVGHHKTPGLLVCEAINRSYPPWEPFSIKWENSHFQYDPVPPVIQTSANSRGSGQIGAPPTSETIMELFHHGCMPMAVFEQRLSELCTVRKGKAFKAQLVGAGKLQRAKEHGKNNGQFYIGTPEQIRDFNEELAAEANEEWDKQDNRGCGW